MCRWEVGNHQGRQKHIAQQKIRACVEVSPWESLLPVQLSTPNILKPVSVLSQHQHVTKYRFLWTTHQSLWPSQFTCFFFVFFCQSCITPLCFSLCFFPGFFPLLYIFHCSFPLFFHRFSLCFPPILTPSHPSQHCPSPSHPYLSKVLCRLFCVFAWRSASAGKLLVAKTTKVSV